MTQINVNDPDPNNPQVVNTTPPQVVNTTPPQVVNTTPTTTDHGSGGVAAGINMVTKLVVLAVALVLMYFIYQMVMPMLGR